MKTANKNSKNVTVKNSTVKQIDLSKISAEQLAELDLDKVNLYDLLEQNKNVQQKLIVVKGEKESMYKRTSKKPNETDKNFRKRIRNTRNTFVENVINFFRNGMTNELKKEIVSFENFYKETYLKNDYSIASIARLNSDKITLGKLNIFFTILKQSKVKTTKIKKEITKVVLKNNIDNVKKQQNEVLKTVLTKSELLDSVKTN